MLPDRVSNPGPLTYELGALPIALHGPALRYRKFRVCCICTFCLYLRTSSTIFATLKVTSESKFYTWLHLCATRKTQNDIRRRSLSIKSVKYKKKWRIKDNNFNVICKKKNYTLVSNSEWNIKFLVGNLLEPHFRQKTFTLALGLFCLHWKPTLNFIYLQSKTLFLDNSLQWLTPNAQ